MISVCMYSSLNYSVYNYVCSTLVLFVCSTLVLFMCSTLVLFLCSTLVLFVCTTNSHLGVAKKGRVADRGWQQTDKLIFRLLSYIVGY